jgi:hypothetical protein
MITTPGRKSHPPLSAKVITAAAQSKPVTRHSGASGLAGFGLKR